MRKNEHAFASVICVLMCMENWLHAKYTPGISKQIPSGTDTVAKKHMDTPNPNVQKKRSTNMNLCLVLRLQDAIVS